MGEISLPMKLKSMSRFPGDRPPGGGDSYNFNEEDRERERERGGGMGGMGEGQSNKRRSFPERSRGIGPTQTRQSNIKCINSFSVSSA